MCLTLSGMLFLLPQESLQLRHRLEKINNDFDSINFKLFWFLIQYYLKLSPSQLPMTSLGVLILNTVSEIYSTLHFHITIRHLEVG